MIVANVKKWITRYKSISITALALAMAILISFSTINVLTHIYRTYSETHTLEFSNHNQKKSAALSHSNPIASEKEHVLDQFKYVIQRNLLQITERYQEALEIISYRISFLSATQNVTHTKAISGLDFKELPIGVKNTLPPKGLDKTGKLFTQHEDNLTSQTNTNSKDINKKPLDKSDCNKTRHLKTPIHVQQAAKIADDHKTDLSAAKKHTKPVDKSDPYQINEVNPVVTQYTLNCDYPEKVKQHDDSASDAIFKDKYNQTIDRLEKKLNIELRNFGEDHPVVARSLINLGAAWHVMGEYDKAIDCFELALDSSLKTFGEDHLDVAIILSNLGSVWKDKGVHDKAIEYYEKSLMICTRNLGKDHQITESVYNKLLLVKSRDDKKQIVKQPDQVKCYDAKGAHHSDKPRNKHG